MNPKQFWDSSLLYTKSLPTFFVRHKETHKPLLLTTYTYVIPVNGLKHQDNRDQPTSVSSQRLTTQPKSWYLSRCASRGPSLWEQQRVRVDVDRLSYCLTRWIYKKVFFYFGMWSLHTEKYKGVSVGISESLRVRWSSRISKSNRRMKISFGIIGILSCKDPCRRQTK